MTALLRAPSGWRAQTDVPHALRDRVVDHVLAPVTLVLVVVTVASGALSLAGVTIPPAVQIVPFAVSVLLFGLPHGALDHLVPARLRPGTSTTRSVLGVVALYVVVGAGTAALWTATPLVGFLVFIGITWFHWGQGDLWVDRLLGDGAAGPLDATVTVLVRGALPMVVPFVAQPTAALSVVTGTVTALGDHASAPTAGVVLPGAVRVAAGVLVLSLVVLHLVRVRRSGQPVWRQATEDLVLLAFFALVPPVLAVGLYFTLWHAVRHVLRLELTDPVAVDRLERGHLLGAFLRFCRQAWPVTAAAVALLVVVATVLRQADLAVYLALIAALTTPHTVVVTWMDHVQRTWRPPTAAPAAPSGTRSP
ncbi:Brp/Blh family beta-carotene 15,15'-dioxygenase [uncultured Curtobacterium sp.]|uniref:Brp/Blh family beta-carotene 15,15'-dioxygenase n=1 Tax=uncultured Curtobacterium sp. TaxID=331964 RepID=UPI00258CDD15|nr:Brp/Blh family beta-carotene 15,15'-dioxygenase [uncultured Curtobacterium sp.]